MTDWMNEWMAQPMIVTSVKSFDWLSPGLSFSSVKCGCWSRSWKSLQLWNVMLGHSVTVQSLQHFYFLPANAGNVVEQRSVQLWSWKKEMVLKIKWAELNWNGLFWIEWKVVVTVCIHFILTIAEPIFVFYL